jgi:hypothetical protein
MNSESLPSYFQNSLAPIDQREDLEATFLWTLDAVGDLEIWKCESAQGSWYAITKLKYEVFVSDLEATQRPKGLQETTSIPTKKECLRCKVRGV